MNCLSGKLYFFIVVVFLLFSTGIKAQNVPEVAGQDEVQSGKYSLLQAVNYAMENNYGIINSKLDIEIARKKILETTSIGLPQVSGELNFQNFLEIPTQVLPANAFNPQADGTELIPIKFGTNYTAVAGLTASQIVFDGAYIVGLQASKAYGQLFKDQLVKSQNDLRASVAQAYYSALVAMENEKILKQSIENTKKLLLETTEIYKSGFVEETDVDQLSLLVQNLQNSLSRSERQSDLALRLLKFQMGMEIGQQIELTENLDNVLLTMDIEALNMRNFEPVNHIDYQLMHTQQNLMKLNLKKERSAYLPSVGAFISHNENAFRNEFDFFSDRTWYPTTVWGIKLKMPIFDSGMKYARISQSKMEYEKTRITAQQVEQNLKLEAQASKEDLINAYERLLAEKQNLVLAEKIQNKTLIKYQEGLASSMELNLVQNQLLTTQGNYIRTVYEVLHTKARFDKATYTNSTEQ